jgi:hypothetical protein
VARWTDKFGGSASSVGNSVNLCSRVATIVKRHSPDDGAAGGVYLRLRVTSRSELLRRLLEHL